MAESHQQSAENKLLQDIYSITFSNDKSQSAYQLKRALKDVPSHCLRNTLKKTTSYGYIIPDANSFFDDVHVSAGTTLIYSLCREPVTENLLRVVCDHLGEDHLIELLQLKDVRQQTPLHHAAETDAFAYWKCGNLLRLNTLMDYISNNHTLFQLLKTQDCDGKTPLHHLFGDPYMVFPDGKTCVKQILFSRLSSMAYAAQLLQIKDIKGETLLHRVATCHRGSSISVIADWCSLLSTEQLVNVLGVQNKNGDNVFHKIYASDSPITNHSHSIINPCKLLNEICAVSHTQRRHLSHLLLQRNNSGTTPLDIAASCGLYIDQGKSVDPLYSICLS